MPLLLNPADGEAMSSSGTLRDLHAGVLHKVGGRVKTWHKRWMVIRSDYCLYYYKDPTKSPQGSISLRDPGFSVRDGTKSDASWPKNCNPDNTLVLATSSRTYYMFAESLAEAQEWKEQLEKAVELMKKEGTKGRSGKTNTADEAWGSCRVQAANLQRPETAAVDTRWNPKQYRKKERRQPTRRFNEVIGSEERALTSDSDLEEPKSCDGELDPTEFDRVPVPTSPTSDEGLYTLASSMDDHVSPSLGNRSATTCNSTNHKLSHPDLRNKRSSSSVDVHESLYDLVAKINADDSASGPVSTSDPDSSQKPPAPPPPPSQDTYEPVESTPPVDSYEPVTSPLPSPAPVSQSVRGQPLPSLPPPASIQSQSDIYEAIDTPTDPPSNLYEDIGGDRVDESASSDEEGESAPKAIAPGPPLPPREAGPPIPPKGSQQETVPPPSIPPRSTPAPHEDNPPHDHDSNIPVDSSNQHHPPPLPRVPRTKSTSSSPPRVAKQSPLTVNEASPSETAHRYSPTAGEDIYDDIVPAAPTEDQEIYDDTIAVSKPSQEEGEEIYDDTLSVLKPSEKGGEVYDDIEGVLQQRKDKQGLPAERVKRPDMTGEEPSAAQPHVSSGTCQTPPADRYVSTGPVEDQPGRRETRQPGAESREHISGGKPCQSRLKLDLMHTGRNIIIVTLTLYMYLRAN